MNGVNSFFVQHAQLTIMYSCRNFDANDLELIIKCNNFFNTVMYFCDKSNEYLVYDFPAKALLSPQQSKPESFAVT